MHAARPGRHLGGLHPGRRPGARYKYAITPRGGGYARRQGRPLRLRRRAPARDRLEGLGPGRATSGATATGWPRARKAQAPDAPLSIYEVHLGSWMRVPEEDNRWLTYRELAPKLADYAHEMGFTHVELLPVAEHPFDGSWGYRAGRLLTPRPAGSARPTTSWFLVDTLHQRGIGVILDWVPAHFPDDPHGLSLLRRHPPLRAPRPAPRASRRTGTRSSSTTAARRSPTS